MLKKIALMLYEANPALRVRSTKACDWPVPNAPNDCGEA